jgi:capsular exopolysaccharide synthesis family protein
MEIQPSDLELVQNLPASPMQKPLPPRSRKGKFPKELWASFGEDCRTLRTKVIRALGEGANKVVLVTSAVPREGKTSASLNLARSFAAAERTTLLVDADLRRPDLHTLFGVEQAGGLSDVVQGRRQLDDAIISTDVAHLELLTAGTRANAPAELLGARPFQDLLRDLARRYEYVVVDSAPLISITDTLLLAPRADGILMVVRGLSTPREIVKSAFEQIHDLPVLGVVLNGISMPRRYGYYY